MAKKAAAKTPKKAKKVSAKTATKAEDFRARSADELNSQLSNLKKEQFNLRFQRATGQLENTSRVRQVRRDIARIKTVAGQKRPAEPAAAASIKPKRLARSKAK